MAEKKVLKPRRTLWKFPCGQKVKRSSENLFVLYDPFGAQSFKTRVLLTKQSAQVFWEMADYIDAYDAWATEHNQ